MASNENKDPIGNLMDKLRSLLGFQERQNNTLPPKARFSIWYFLIAWKNKNMEKMEGQMQITTVFRGLWDVFAERLWHFYRC